jgi:hypothetical protein
MKKINNILLILVAIFLWVSCKKENRCDCIKRTGPIVSETRNLGHFTKIKAEDNVDVFISQGATQEVKVQAGKNIVPLIETVIEDGTLIIRNKNRCNWSRSYKKELSVYITVSSIKWIINEGTATIKSLNTFTEDTLDVQTTNSGDLDLSVNTSKLLSHIFGSGDIRLQGTTYEHACNIGGTSYLYAQKLHTDYTYIDTHTIGPSEISVAGLLICRIERKGDVFCYGNPTNIQRIITGTGQLYLK